MSGNINIIGTLSAFGALGVALFLISMASSVAGLKDLAGTTSFWGGGVLLLVILGAVLKIASRFR